MGMRVHIDTDFGGDTDDACAVAMTLGWPDVELVGITTTADLDGQRAGYLCRFLELAGRRGVRVAAGACRSLTTGGPMGALPGHERYWGMPAPARPSPLGVAMDLLAHSIELGATIVALGPYTNLALLQQARPGWLDGVPVVAMGGWVEPPEEDLPAWGPEMDWNVQCDTSAALTVAASADLTLVPLPVTLRAHLTAAELPRLAATGPLGQLLARQARAHGQDHDMAVLGRAHAGLPDDLVNFHYDPVACAVAFGWDGAVVQKLRLLPVFDNDVLRFEPDQAGRSTRVVVGIDSEAFANVWITAVEAAQHRP
jgi:inosine-uridine nucleoside N-ribohydrolase